MQVDVVDRLEKALQERVITVAPMSDAKSEIRFPFDDRHATDSGTGEPLCTAGQNGHRFGVPNMLKQSLQIRRVSLHTDGHAAHSRDVLNMMACTPHENIRHFYDVAGSDFPQ